MATSKDSETYTKQEAAKRRDEALKRALNTPPKPLSSVAREAQAKRGESPKKERRPGGPGRRQSKNG